MILTPQKSYDGQVLNSYSYSIWSISFCLMCTRKRRERWGGRGGILWQNNYALFDTTKFSDYSADKTNIDWTLGTVYVSIVFSIILWLKFNRIYLSTLYSGCSQFYSRNASQFIASILSVGLYAYLHCLSWRAMVQWSEDCQTIRGEYTWWGFT